MKNYVPEAGTLVNSLKGVSSRMLRKKNLPQHPKKTMGQCPLVADLNRR